MTRKPVHVAMYSGGASSAYVAYHMVQTYGRENSILFLLTLYGSMKTTIALCMKWQIT